MAHLVTLTLLINDDNDGHVCDGVNEMLRTAQQPIEQGGDFWLVDWSLDNVRPTLKELDKSLTKGSYAEGDLQRDWVAFSAKEAATDPGSNYGYWSDNFGWTTLDLATKYDASDRDTPITEAGDVVWMMAPYSYTAV